MFESTASPILIAIAFFGLGAGVVFFTRFNKTSTTHISLGMAMLGGVAAVTGSVVYWRNPLMPSLNPFAVPAFIEGFPSLHFSLYIDPLSAFFMLLIGSLTTGVSLYSLVWLKDTPNRRRIASLFNLLILSTLLVVVMDNTFYFLVALEGMTLSFGFLTLYKHNQFIEGLISSPRAMEESKRAFKTYLISSHVGLVFITIAFLLLAVQCQSFNFSDFRMLNLSSHYPLLANLIFGLGLTGFGIKAALVPFHPWLPITHPHSPTNIHAIMSGLIIKVAGIYGLLRLLFEFLKPIPWEWGAIVLILGGITAVAGVFYAITSLNLKTALANHSIENVGIILVGIGLALIFSSTKFTHTSAVRGLAALALVAALYHTLNHAIFKGLLFLATGAIENRTGTVEMDSLGGLIKRYPWTAVTFLIGAVSIAGFPPFNGFISEWLTLQSLFAGWAKFDRSVGLRLRGSMLIAAFLLSAAIGLTALAFAKITGETLLGPPRKAKILKHERPGDVPWAMRSVLVTLAVLCLLLGLFPVPVINWLTDAACQLTHSSNACRLQTTQLAAQTLPVVKTTNASVTITLPAISAESDDDYATQLPILPLLLPASIAAATAFGLSRIRRKKPLAPGAVWNCGAPYQAETMQITGEAYAFLTWGAISKKLPANTDPDATAPPVYVPFQFFMTTRRYVIEFFRWSYNAATALLVRWSNYLGDSLQNGDVRHYLLYILAAFLLVLFILINL